MERIEIIAATGNKFIIPNGIPSNQKIWKRALMIQYSYRNGNNFRITFDTNERARIDDFFNRINQRGGSESYSINFISENKWIESRIIEPETDLVLNFVVYCEDKMIDGDIMEI